MCLWINLAACKHPLGISSAGLGGSRAGISTHYLFGFFVQKPTTQAASTFIWVDIYASPNNHLQGTKIFTPLKSSKIYQFLQKTQNLKPKKPQNPKKTQKTQQKTQQKTKIQKSRCNQNEIFLGFCQPSWIPPSYCPQKVPIFYCCPSVYRYFTKI